LEAIEKRRSVRVYQDEPSGHGLGFGDINGDGWLDIVTPEIEGLYLFENLRRK
jgi:hypothetical protein